MDGINMGRWLFPILVPITGVKVDAGALTAQNDVNLSILEIRIVRRRALLALFEVQLRLKLLRSSMEQ